MVPSLIFALFVLPTAFLVLDLIVWRAIDQRLRPLRWARVWRGILAAFMAVMVAYIALVLMHLDLMRRSQSPMPLAVHITAYLWHFIGLPLALIWLGFATLARWVGKLFARRSKPSTTATNADELERRARTADRASGSDTRSAARTLPAEAIDASDQRGVGALDGAFERETRSAMRTLPIPTSSQPTSPNAPWVSPRPTRRQMLAAAAAVTPPLLTGALSARSTLTLYGRRLRAFNLVIPQLPPQLDGMTIAHVSDTHIGKFLHPDRLPAIAEDVNKLDADFVVFTGDLIDLSLHDLPYGIDFLHRLKSRCGIAICEGNHDIMEDRGEFEQQIQEAGLPIIVGNQLTLPYVSRSGRSFPVQFLGTPWNFTDPEMSDAVDFLKPIVRSDAFPILLAHHPHHFDAASQASMPLVLSGHTHGGQIMLNDHFGAGSLRFRYLSGLYQKNGSSLIVNNGLGNWFPLRVNAPAELIHITLRCV